MQGMIADTGDAFHLYKKHHTVAMITDWVLHPFEHLRRPPAVHMAKMLGGDAGLARRRACPLRMDDPRLTCEACPYRRAVIVEVAHDSPGRVRGRDVFAFNTSRRPVGVADVNCETREIVNARSVPGATAWKDVPTPPF
jgi:hypothetical protein